MSRKIRLATEIATILHENFRQSMKQEDGTYKDKWRVIKDTRFIRRLQKNNLPNNIRFNGVSYEINLTTSKYCDLSPDWQLQNKSAGEVVEKIINSGKSYSRNQVGTIIHNEWLKRNPEAKKDPILSKPFEELPKEEQDKDWEQFVIGLRIFNERNI